MGQPILSVEHLQVCYTGKPVLEDVSLTLLPGQILGIVGESGSGKSTLIRAAMGLLGSDGAVTGGSIRYIPCHLKEGIRYWQISSVG